MKLRWSMLLPALAFSALLMLLARGLQLDAHALPSALVGHPAPAFALVRLDDANQRLQPADYAGQVWLLNVWASWCAPCRAELPALKRLADASGTQIVGLNYKDTPPQARAFLQSHGNPYAATALDARGQAGIDWGVTGVPETFVIDRHGVVRHKHAGPVTDEDVRDRLLPLIKELQRE